MLVEAQFSIKNRGSVDRAVDRPCTDVHRGSSSQPSKGSSGSIRQRSTARSIDYSARVLTESWLSVCLPSGRRSLLLGFQVSNMAHMLEVGFCYWACIVAMKVVLKPSKLVISIEFLLFPLMLVRCLIGQVQAQFSHQGATQSKSSFLLKY